MVALNISETLAATLDAYAKREGRSVEALLEKLLAEYNWLPPSERTIEEQSAALAAMSGLFDDEVTDLSSTVHENVQHALRKKYGSAD